MPFLDDEPDTKAHCLHCIEKTECQAFKFKCEMYHQNQSSDDKEDAVFSLDPPVNPKYIDVHSRKS